MLCVMETLGEGMMVRINFGVTTIISLVTQGQHAGKYMETHRLEQRHQNNQY